MAEQNPNTTRFQKTHPECTNRTNKKPYFLISEPWLIKSSNGMKPNLTELLLLNGSLCPIMICLQKTFLKENNNVKICYFTSYDYVNSNTNRASGGISILINNKIFQHRIHFNTNLQAVASATLHHTITVCSVYILPHDQIIDTELLEQLPGPFILMGDFNSHNIIWRCKEINKKR